jgi:hypothetical protein
MQVEITRENSAPPPLFPDEKVSGLRESRGQLASTAQARRPETVKLPPLKACEIRPCASITTCSNAS